MRIALHPVSNDLGPFQVLRRCAGAIRAAGFRLDEFADQPPGGVRADVSVIHQKYATNSILDGMPENSVVLMERIDSAQLWSRQAAEHPAVFACAKVAALPGDKLVEPYARYHEYELVGDVASSNLSPLSDQAVAKVLPGPHYGQYDRIGRFGECGPDLDDDRPLDLFFAGSVDIYQTTIAAHRRTCVRAAESLSNQFYVHVVGSKSLPREKYDSLTRLAKAVVSPWGNGELCHRDFDAMWCGAVLIKPYSDHLRTDPLMFKNGVTYFACKPDFSDLREVMQNISDRWDDLRPMRAANYGRVHAAFRPEYTAAWMQRAIQEAA